MRKLFFTLFVAMLALGVSAQDTIVLRDFSFTPSTLTIPVGRKVVFRNEQGFHNVNGTQTTFPSNPVSFGNSVAAAPWTYEFTFNTAGTYRFQCDPHAGQMQGTLIVQNYPLYTIPVVSTENVNGVADSLNKIAEVRGVVYGGNLRTTGVQFTIIDRNNNGIGVFNASKNFGYTTVTQGDSVIVRGKVDQFSGLTQIAADTIIRISQNTTLIAPAVVTAVSENTESKLITIQNVRLINPAQWTNAAGGFNVNLTTTGTDTIVMRIDSEVDIFGKGAPSGTFNVTGIGTQFDATSPFTTGYQIIPRFSTDINPYNQASVGYPYYDISVLRTNDATGRADSLNKKVEVRGIVYGPNIRGVNNGLQFTLIERDGDGTGIFSTTKTFGYTVTQGDSLIVRGTVDQFNGLTQIIPDTLFRISQNNPLRTPVVVDTLNENSESRFVRINGLMLVTPAQWTTNVGTGFNVDATNGTRTFQIRIDNDVNLFSQPAPTGKFDLIGIGGQFDNTSPFTSGYQIFPRSTQDLILITSVVDPTLAEGVKLYPNPVVNELTLESPNGFDRIRVSNVAGQQLLDFKNVNTKAQLNLSQLTPGVYNLTLVRGNTLYTLPFVKK